MEIDYESIHFPRKPYEDAKITYLVQASDDFWDINEETRNEILWNDFLDKHDQVIRREDSKCWADMTAELFPPDSQYDTWYFVVTMPFLD